MKQENVIQKARLERIRVQAVQHLKEFKSKAFQVFMLLDDWIGTKFQAEMDAIREMVNFIKESIESEQRLPNELICEGN